MASLCHGCRQQCDTAPTVGRSHIPLPGSLRQFCLSRLHRRHCQYHAERRMWFSRRTGDLCTWSLRVLIGHHRQCLAARRRGVGVSAAIRHTRSFSVHGSSPADGAAVPRSAIRRPGCSGLETRWQLTVTSQTQVQHLPLSTIEIYLNCGIKLQMKASLLKKKPLLLCVEWLI